MLTRVANALIVAVFLALTLPVAMMRPAGGRSMERQGQTAGIIRAYCENPAEHFLKAPQIHYGRRPFNLELTLFEWLQGGVARAIDGPECDSVERVAKVFSVLVSALGILAIAALATELWRLISMRFRVPDSDGAAPWAGLMAAFLLGTDELWMRYSTYTMVENRVLVCGLLAVLFSLKRRAAWAFVFWSLTVAGKPQTSLFLAAFWGVCEVILHRGAIFGRHRRILYAFLGSVALGGAYFAWSARVNAASDLPWVTWTGPRVNKWYFGDWGERFQWVYAKNQILDWLRRSGLLVVTPILLVFGAMSWRALLAATLPLFAARFAYSFALYNVFKAHEYCALPLNIGTFLTLPLAYAFLVRAYQRRPQRARAVLLLPVIVLAALGVPSAIGIRDYLAFASRINDSSSRDYATDWAVQVFPKRHGLVAMASSGNGRDILSLYYTKQRGFMWCASNPAFAPRAFWKEQGVEYVAWAEGVDPTTRRVHWAVRSMDEELAFARLRGWSSDQNDAWAGRTMADWAALSSRTFQDPCDRDHFDPRKWVN